MIFSPFQIPGQSLRRPRRNGRYHARACPGHTQVIDLHLERSSQNRTCRKARLLRLRGKVTTILRRHLIPVSQMYVIYMIYKMNAQYKPNATLLSSLNDTNKVIETLILLVPLSPCLLSTQTCVNLNVQVAF